VLDSYEKLFVHMQSAGKSRYVRELGKELMNGEIMNYSNLRLDVSSIDCKNVSLD
jgi:hypothetical protein